MLRRSQQGPRRGERISGPTRGEWALALSRASATARRALPSIVVAVALAAAVMTIVPAAAHAGRPGKWTNLTGSTGSTQTLVSVARTTDGRLHVVWTRDAADGKTYDLCYRVVARGGGFSSQSTLIAGWSILGAPTIVAEQGGALSAFVCGSDVFGPGQTHHGMCVLRRAAGSAGWVVSPGVIDNGDDKATAYASDAFATLAADGTPLVGWWKNRVWVHAGLDPSRPQHEFLVQTGTTGSYFPTLVTNTAGRSYIAWSSIVDKHRGVQVQQVAVDGSPVGSPLQLPKCDVIDSDGWPQFFLMTDPVPFAALPSGGLVAAYPTGHPNPVNIRFWRMSGSDPLAHMRSRVIAKGFDTKNQVALAVDARSRVWVVWSSHLMSDSPAVLMAQRSNAGGTKWGAPVTIKAPSANLSLFRIVASAQKDRLDLFAHWGQRNQGTDGSTFHTQVRPGLSVVTKPVSLRVGKKAVVRVTVRDAGKPVARATVKILGRTVRTNAKGAARVTIARVPKAGWVKMSVTRKGYTTAKTMLIAH